MDQPTRATPSKMLYYKKHFKHFSTKIFRYIFLPKGLRVAIGQLGVSSHQLEIENDCANGVTK